MTDLDGLHTEALAENEERDWYRTGRIPCSDCGTMVRTETLETLPEHRCAQRQRARREQGAAFSWPEPSPRMPKPAPRSGRRALTPAGADGQAVRAQLVAGAAPGRGLRRGQAASGRPCLGEGGSSIGTGGEL